MGPQINKIFTHRWQSQPVGQPYQTVLEETRRPPNRTRRSESSQKRPDWRMGIPEWSCPSWEPHCWPSPWRGLTMQSHLQNPWNPRHPFWGLMAKHRQDMHTITTLRSQGIFFQTRGTQNPGGGGCWWKSHSSGPPGSLGDLAKTWRAASAANDRPIVACDQAKMLCLGKDRMRKDSGQFGNGFLFKEVF